MLYSTKINCLNRIFPLNVLINHKKEEKKQTIYFLRHFSKIPLSSIILSQNHFLQQQISFRFCIVSEFKVKSSVFSFDLSSSHVINEAKNKIGSNEICSKVVSMWCVCGWKTQDSLRCHSKIREEHVVDDRSTPWYGISVEMMEHTSHRCELYVLCVYFLVGFWYSPHSLLYVHMKMPL